MTSNSALPRKPPIHPPLPQGNITTVLGIHLTNSDKVLYPEQGLTKRDLVSYYVQVADWVLPHVARRPLLLLRCPQGRGFKCFYQKHLTESTPKAVRGVAIREENKEAVYMMIRDLPGLVALVQMGVMEIHPWSSRAEDVEHPDRIVFDLDPGPEVPWKMVIEGAWALRDLLGELGLETFVRTTGGKGLHIVAPIEPELEWDEVRAFTKTISESMARQDPTRYVADMSKARRLDRIYLDYLRNARGATAIASYSTRAKSGAPIATPLRWEELPCLAGPRAYTIANLIQRLEEAPGDPWHGFFELRQSMTDSRRRLLPQKGGG